MRLIRLALAVMAVSFSWGAMANPAVNNGVVGSVSGTVSTTAATQMVGGAAQVRLDGAHLSGDGRASSRASSATRGMNESVPSGWLMALVTVLLIGHQLRRKHRFLRPQRFSNF
jgi:hypothetical protein